MKKENQKIILYAGGLAIIYFGIIRPITNKLGITKSATDKVVENQSNLPNNINPFSPIFYKKGPKGQLLLTSNSARSLAKAIYDALGFFGDDEAKIYSVFRGLKTQSQASFLSDTFTNMYNTDLLEYLKRGSSQYSISAGLNEEELNTVISIVNKLPKYKV